MIKIKRRLRDFRELNHLLHTLYLNLGLPSSENSVKNWRTTINVNKFAVESAFKRRKMADKKVKIQINYLWNIKMVELYINF